MIDTKSGQHSKQSRLPLILGAGVSVGAGLPLAAEVDEAVRSGILSRRGGGVQRLAHSTTSAYMAVESLAPDRYTQRITAFVARVLAVISNYFAPHVAIGYEDVFYLVLQVHEALNGNNDNPALEPLLGELDKYCRETTAGDAGDELPPLSRWDLLRTALETTRFIRDAVRIKVSLPASADLSYLDPLLETAQLDFVGLDVFTLNHDTVIEQYFSSKGIAYADGFGEPQNGVRYWDSGLLDDPASHRLFRLHGSIVWEWFKPERPLGTDLRAPRLGIAVDGDVWHTVAPDGRSQLPGPDGPLFLCGRHNKIIDYQAEPFSTLHNGMWQALRAASLMVVAGYSFADKGINRRLWEWVEQRTDTRIVLIEPDPDGLLARCRPLMQRALRDWMGRNRLRMLPVRAEEVDSSQLLDALRGAS